MTWKLSMSFAFIILIFICSNILDVNADTLTLKSGKQIQGTIISEDENWVTIMNSSEDENWVTFMDSSVEVLEFSNVKMFNKKVIGNIVKDSKAVHFKAGDPKLDDIAEAVIKFKLKDTRTSRPDLRKDFISILGQDPSAELLQRFNEYPFPVLPASQYVVNEYDHILWEISSAMQLENGDVVVSAGYYAGPLNAAGGFLMLKLIDGVWDISPFGPQSVA